MLSEHPYRERLHEIHMIALAAARRKADALAVYRELYRRFADDLGVEPGRSLREVERRILRGEVPLAVRPHGPVVPRQLPPAAAALTGRDHLIDAIRGDLGQTGARAARIAVLVRPGGIGKTALAVASAHALVDAYPGGQLFADLRGAREDPADPHAVLGRFLRALGGDGARVPEDPDERIATYRTLIADRRILVVLHDAGSGEGGVLN